MTLPIFWKPAAGLLVVAAGGLIVWAEDATYPGRCEPRSVVCAAEPPVEEKGPGVPESAFAPPPPLQTPDLPPKPAEPAAEKPAFQQLFTPPADPAPVAEAVPPVPPVAAAPPVAPPSYAEPTPPPAMPAPAKPEPASAAVPPVGCPVTPPAPKLAPPVAPVVPPVVQAVPPPVAPLPPVAPAEPVRAVGFSSPATTTVITSGPVADRAGEAACQLSLKVGTGLPHFEIRAGEELLLKAKCERVDMQSSPDASHRFLGLQATGRVQVTGSGLTGTCEQMTVQSLGGEVTLKGNVRVTFRKGTHVTEMAGEQMTFRVSDRGLTVKSDK